jgi:flavin-binding monooxygenase-like protein
VHFIDGNSVKDVDSIVFGTGYSWTLPFLPNVEVRNNRVPYLYQHVVYQKDPSLLFVGAVAAGLTFKVFEWQAVLAARLLAGRAVLPPLAEQEKWEQDRIAERGDGPKFTAVFPDFEDYFETLRGLAGPGENELGRQLPPFKREWFKAFLDGLELRKNMWRRFNTQALDELDVNLNGLDLSGRKQVGSPPPTYGWALEKFPRISNLETDGVAK